MTVSYSQKCMNNNLLTFGKLLFKWRGSVYKIIYKETAIFIIIFLGLSLVYYFLDEEQKQVFINVVNFCKQGTKMLPLSFVMGNFVSLVVSDRWNKILKSIPYPDRYYKLSNRTLINFIHKFVLASFKAL